MSHYIKFDIESEMQNQKDTLAKVANPANPVGEISNFSKISRGSPQKTQTIADFVNDCCTIDPSANVRGAELLMALSRWRRYIDAADGECIWDQLHQHLESIGCSCDVLNGPATWYGVALKESGPHTVIPPHHRIEACTNCDATNIFSRGPVRVCKGCKHEWLLPCPQCGGSEWEMPKGRWTCTTCGCAWEPYVDLRSDIPTALTMIEAADGRQLTLGIYRCPGCGGTNWGPMLDDPETWHCLDCYASKISDEAIP